MMAIALLTCWRLAYVAAIGGTPPDEVVLANGPFTESWQDMISRDQQWRAAHPGQPLPIEEPPLPGGKPKPDEPEPKPEASSGLPAPQREAAPAPAAAPAPPAQTIGFQFPGISGANPFPPDTMGAVGPNDFMEILNGTVAFFRKADGVVRIGPVSLTSFFTVKDAKGITHPQNGAFDPRVVFDRHTGRFFASALEQGQPKGDKNGLMLAVSLTSDPAGGWTKFFLDVGAPLVFVPVPHPLPGNVFRFTDYDTLAVDDNGVYLGMRIVPEVNVKGFTFEFAQIVVIPKATLLATPSGGSVPVFLWKGTNTDIPIFGSPQPALNLDVVGSGDPAFFVGTPVNSASLFSFVSTSTMKNIIFHAVTWAGGRPTLGRPQTVNTPEYGHTPDAPAAGSTKRIDTGDDRLQAAMIRNGSLVTARTIGVNSGGGATNRDRSACEWFELGINGSKLQLIQRGLVFDTFLTVPRFFYYPSIVATGQGHVVMGFSGSAAHTFVDAFFTGRLDSDPLNGMRAVQLLSKQAGSSYTHLDKNKRNRWGDYSATSLDPNDDMTAWTIQEFAASTPNTWATNVTQLLAPPPATPILANPSAITVGLPSVEVAIIGTSVDGSAFYDPGLGFPNHISASVVVPPGEVPPRVNSVIFSSSKSVVLNLNTINATPVTNATVVITNPDGQSASGSILSIRPAVRLTNAVSVKLHGPSGSPREFDLTLSLNPSDPAVEPRLGGPTRIDFTFDHDIMGTHGAIGSNDFTIDNAKFVNAFIINNRLILSLEDVGDQSVVSVTLNGIVDLQGDPLVGLNTVKVRALLGDVNQDRKVSVSDLQAVKDHLAQQPTIIDNIFIFDVDLSDTITTDDLKVVQNDLLHTVP